VANRQNLPRSLGWASVGDAWGGQTGVESPAATAFIESSFFFTSEEVRINTTISLLN
jgi:hypothetical protein